MEVKDFVAQILVDLDAAIEEARKNTSREIHFSVNKNNRTVEFDIAVSTEQGSSKSGKAGIKVLGLADGDASLSSESKNSVVSRIQFGVYIAEQTKNEEREQTAAFEARNNQVPSFI
jgi:hypothetical protein